MKLKSTIYLALFLLLPQVVFADDWQVNTVFGMVNTQNTALSDYLNLILDFLYGIMGLVAVIRIFYGAFQYIQSNGNPDQAQKGKRIIQHAVYGLLLVLCAAVITVTFVTIKLPTIK